ncbi:MAG: hypothetical protein OER91_12790 [Gammaproteobacteria bacterium]|nr:hypothetical protein [Gammaproteobacteria bacterium]
MRLLFLSLALLAHSVAAANGFDEFTIDAGFRVEQRVLLADLYGDGQRQVLIAGRDDAHKQHLAVYSLESIRNSSTKPLITLKPGANLIAYDVGQLGDQDALLFIEPGRVSRYNLEDRKFVQVLKIKSIYGQQRTGDIVPIDFFRDLNDDGLDDLVVPDTAGYRIRLQKPDGGFGEESLLEESSRMTVAGRRVSFETRPLFSGDMNFDGLTDLGVWRGNALRVYAQLPDHRYRGEPDTVELGLGLLSEDELRALQDDAGAVDQRGLTQKHIVSVEDHNGDGIPDILVESTMSSGVFDKRNNLGLHLGRRQGDLLTYRDAEDALLASEGLQFGMVATDIDADDLQDLVVRTVRLSFSRVIKALFSGNVSLRLNFFRMTPDGTYPEEPDYVARTSVHFSMSSGQIDIPTVEVADFDGDGLKDLMMQTRPDRLTLSRGDASQSLFSDNEIRFDVDLPRNGELVESDDVNDDGLADLVMRYTTADGEQASHIVRILIANFARGD